MVLGQERFLSSSLSAMSTKNLGRTAIERGRTTRYKDRVEEFEGSFRTANRDFNRKAANDVEICDIEVDPALRPRSKKGHQTDHLSPVYKMLDSMVGRPWTKVFSEICQKLDGRTLAGWHVLYQHILTEIDPHAHIPQKSYWRVNDYFVDDRGVFSKRKSEKRHYPVRKISLKYAEKIRAWLNGRAVIRQGSKLYWGIGCINGQTRDHVPLTLDVYQGNVSGMHFGRPLGPAGFTPYYPSYSWRQNQSLSREETAFFNSMPKWVHNIIVVNGAEKKAA